MRISDWSSDVCSSDLRRRPARKVTDDRLTVQMQQSANSQKPRAKSPDAAVLQAVERALAELRRGASVVLYDWSGQGALVQAAEQATAEGLAARSEEHTSELQSLMRISYAVFCLKKKNKK